MKRLFCRHKLEITKWNSGDHSASCYPREYTCKKCNLKIPVWYNNRYNPVDNLRFFLIMTLSLSILVLTLYLTH